ncbi:MAG: hypothetical protein EPN33_11155 [Acidobacteria bacterium]|nr:MAG: hypothetical protein EPN33_11155 [Acidobacteriota bacterium]
MAKRRDDRPAYDQVGQTAGEWTLILGLGLMAIVWALIAFASIGGGTRINANYNLLRTTPAAQAYNTLHEFQRPRR